MNKLKRMKLQMNKVHLIKFKPGGKKIKRTI